MPNDSFDLTPDASESFNNSSESSTEDGAGSELDSSFEEVETVGINEELFIERMDSFENLFMVQLIGLALIAGCLIATLVMRFFRNV